ncbi:mycofactocin-coupled SDR family oxidoreductase [Telmatospirillum sp. J64-1]|uniref:mycofactocin-coupled SDR family oxidoreductase n=1 Tax=Telmatospirillum sp. J64-1 TaxID=2502183 RepID=UPI00115EE843|nr:mycofactocin-coupled SDR family oxidoreductase [Telmatospirillum sp. J64-1]
MGEGDKQGQAGEPKSASGHEAPAVPETPPSPTRRAVVAGGLTALAGLAAGCAPPPPLSTAAQAAPPGAPAPRGRLEKQVVLVTGAARGIGRSICVACAREGADVVGFDIAGPVSPILPYPPASPQDLQETGNLVAAQQRRFLGVVGDVRDFQALQRAAASAAQQLGGIDVLVANAGINAPVTLEEMNDRQWQDVIDVNLTGAANSMRAVLPYMQVRGGGRMIAISSVEGRIGSPFGAQYNASKWGLIGLVKCAALEWGEQQITVNAVCPTLVNTVMARSPALQAAMIPDELPAGLPESAFVAAATRLHPQRVPWVEPEDVAAAVVFLASEEARYISGATLDVTAGIGGLYTA